MNKAPRYRLVGYDIGTAPDDNGGWVHWTDHEAEISRLRTAMIAMRDDMLDRAECGIDRISGEQYRIVNAGNGAWTGFIEALQKSGK